MSRLQLLDSNEQRESLWRSIGALLGQLTEKERSLASQALASR